MKKGLLIGLGVVVGVVFLIGLFLMGSYNSLVELNEEVDGSFAEISTQLQRRSDLIPNLVNTVKGYTKHEKEVIENITTARENLAGAKTVSEKAAADQELTNALNRLLVIVENYPELKADKNFINLQDELAGTENRIAVARNKYNDSVKSYNTGIKKFPKNVIAGMFNFEEKAYFEAADGAEEVPNVSFE